MGCDENVTYCYGNERLDRNVLRSRSSVKKRIGIFFPRRGFYWQIDGLKWYPFLCEILLRGL